MPMNVYVTDWKPNLDQLLASGRQSLPHRVNSCLSGLDIINQVAEGGILLMSTTVKHGTFTRPNTCIRFVTLGLASY